MIFSRFINYFISYISKKWLIICLVTGVVMWGLTFGIEGYIRKSRGQEVDDRFLSELFMGILPCVGVPFGIYLCVILMRVVITLKRYQNKLLSNLGDYRELFLQPFQINIKLADDEKKMFEIKRAGLEIPDRFNFFVYLIISSKGIYIHGGVLRLKKYFEGITNSEFNITDGYSFFSYNDISSIYTETNEKRNVLTVSLKNNKTFWIRIPGNNFPKNIFPKNISNRY